MLANVETVRDTEGKGTAMAVTGKVIITTAVTGAIHTPTMSPYLPITPDQIVEDALAAAEAGAAILHLHARDPETGKPDQTPEAFASFLSPVVMSTPALVARPMRGTHPATASGVRSRLLLHG